MERRFTLVVLSLLAASMLSVATLAIRVHETHSFHYTFLIWNLFLAWMPLIAASLVVVLARRGSTTLAGVLFVVWLLFFPNAPYMLTDFVHLNRGGTTPLWYDALMLSSFAWTALILGFVSLFLIHGLIGRRAGDAVGWVVVVCVLGLASFGIYLGRFAGFNSWDAVAHPRHILSVIRHETSSPLQDPKMMAALLALTASLCVGYLVVYAISALRLDPAEGVATEGGAQRSEA